MAEPFLKQKGNFRDLIAFQKAECIYDITYYFAHKYLLANDRTIDQMIQAARSGKQNIAEGCSASTTSSETEIKLLNVARASFQELLLDYEDYLRVRELEIWDLESEKSIQTRNVCKMHNDSAFYRKAIKERDDETIANIAITLIYQEDVFLRRYLDKIQSQFFEEGGVRERMSQARHNYRDSHK